MIDTSLFSVVRDISTSVKNDDLRKVKDWAFR